MLMKRIILVMVIVLNLIGAAFANDANFRPKLGCVPFQATSLQAMAFTENISTSLLNYLDNSGFFDLIERKKIEQFSVVEGLSMDNLDLNGIIRIGTTARIDYVAYGSVNTSESGVVLEVNLLRVSSKKLIIQEKYAMSESDYSGKMQAVANSIVDHVKNADKQDMEHAKAPPVVVPPPDKVTAIGTSSSIRLEWQYEGQDQIIGFNIYRANSQDGQYTRYATTTDPFFIDENLKLNDTFYYRIAAVGQTGISEMTMPVKGATAIAPSAPIFMNVEADIKGARLIWRARPGKSDNHRMHASEYLIYRRQGDAGTFSLIARLPVDAATYVDTGLSDGVRYIYTITSRNSEGTESEYSAKLSVQPMAAPGSVRARSGRIRTILISWDEYLGQSGAGYVLYRSDAKDGRYAKIARLEGLNRTSYTDTALMDNITYWYRLSVFNKGGFETDPSEPVSALTRNLPPAPQQLTASNGEARRVKLHWQLAGTAEDEIKRVIVFRSTDAKAGIFEKIAEVTSNQNEYVDRNPPLMDNTTYYYRVCSQNVRGTMSPDSESVRAITKAPPQSPASLSAISDGIKKIVLRWDRNPESDIKWYQLFRKRNDERDFTEFRKIDNTQFEDTNLSNGTEVAYKIRAIDNDGLMSSFSDAVAARTKPLPAKVVGLSIVNYVNRVVSWSANQESDVHSYAIYKKGFLGLPKKLATIQGTSWKLGETKDKVEIYVTAVDDAGLESEASETLKFE